MTKCQEMSEAIQSNLLFGANYTSSPVSTKVVESVSSYSQKDASPSEFEKELSRTINKDNKKDKSDADEKSVPKSDTANPSQGKAVEQNKDEKKSDVIPDAKNSQKRSDQDRDAKVDGSSKKEKTPTIGKNPDDLKDEKSAKKLVEETQLPKGIWNHHIIQIPVNETAEHKKLSGEVKKNQKLNPEEFRAQKKDISEFVKITKESGLKTSTKAELEKLIASLNTKNPKHSDDKKDAAIDEKKAELKSAKQVNQIEENPKNHDTRSAALAKWVVNDERIKVDESKTNKESILSVNPQKISLATNQDSKGHSNKSRQNMEPGLQNTNHIALEKNNAPDQNAFQRVLEQDVSSNLKEQNKELIDNLVKTARLNIKSDGSSSAIIKLNPGSLGHVTLNLRMQDGNFQGKIIVESQAAFKMINDDIENLKMELKQQGITVEGLTVKIRENSESFLNLNDSRNQNNQTATDSQSSPDWNESDESAESRGSNSRPNSGVREDEDLFIEKAVEEHSKSLIDLSV